MKQHIRKIKHLPARAGVLALAGAMLCAAAAAAAGAGADAGVRASALRADYDYSDPQYYFVTTANEADIVSAYTGGISEAERDYLAAHGEILLRYRDAVELASIVTQMTGDTLTVTPAPFTYRSQRGLNVQWKPVSVDGNPVEGFYTVPLAQVEGDSVSVEYETFFSIARDDLNAALSRASAAGAVASADVKAKTEAYEAELGAYNAAKAAHDKYLRDLDAYENELLPAYRNYLTQQAAWERYQAYLTRLSEYNAKKAAHDKWERDYDAWYNAALKWKAYTAEYEEYQRKLEEYNRKLDSADAQKAVRQIACLDFMFTPTQMGEQKRTLFSAVTGSTVDSVIAEKKTIIEVYPNLKGFLDLAESSTRSLRELMYSYRDIAQAQGTTYTQKYAFYILNYDKIAKSVTDLFYALNALFRAEGIVRDMIVRYDRLPQFRILVAQLYTMARLFTDGKLASYQYFIDSGYRFDGSTPAEILAGTDIPEDIDDVTPVEGGVPFPSGQPEEPKRVSEPGAAPAEPAKPGNPPAAVPAATKPAVVTEPTRPVEPSVPAEPAAPVISSEDRALAEAYDEGLLTHERATSDYSFRRTTAVERFFRNGKSILVRFYAEEGAAEPLWSAEAEYGEGVVFPLDLPEKHETGYIFTFSHWQDEEGNEVDLAHIKSELGTLSLYPAFDCVPERYRVIWMVNNVPREGSCDFGAVPVYDEAAFGAPARATDDYAYRFAGWSQNGVLLSELPAITQRDEQFVAEFERSARVEWSVTGRPLLVQYPFAGETIAYPLSTDREDTETEGYVFRGWKQGSRLVSVFPSPVSGERYAYTADYETRPLFGVGTRKATISKEGQDFVADASKYDASSGRWRFDLLMRAVAGEENATLEVRFSAISLYFSAELISELKTENVDTMSANAFLKDGIPRLLVHLYDAGGEELFPEGRILFTASTSFLDFPEGTPLSSLELVAEDGTEEPLDASGDVLSAELAVGTVYELYKHYTVGIAESELAEITLSSERAEAGDVIEAGLTLTGPGYEAALYYSYLDGTGELVTVPIEEGSFVMPTADVRVGVTVIYYEYTASFFAEGRTLYSETYRYGDIINIPPFDPVKADDEQFRYTFSHWEDGEGNRLDDATAITKDVEYTAVFTSAPLPAEPEKEPTKLEKLMSIAKIVVPIVAAVLLALIVLIIVLVVRRKKKKRAAAKRGENAKQGARTGRSGTRKR